MFFAAITFVICQPAVWFYKHGVLFDLDFWGGNFIIVFGATIEVILVAWIFGIDKAWTEMHIGSKIRIPGFFKYVVKYVTPIFLLTILGFWFYKEWIPTIMMDGISSQDMPYILGTRLGLVALLIIFCILIWIAWKRRRRESGEEV
jgi:hypothetical protein